jgi:hypothetical protein
MRDQYEGRLEEEPEEHFSYLGEEGLWTKKNLDARGTVKPADLSAAAPPPAP